MKKGLIKLAFVCLAFSLVLVSCKKDFNINSSEEDITLASLDYKDVLPAAISNTAKIVAADWKFLQNWMGYWARSGSYQNIQDEESYHFTNTFPTSNNPWSDLYYNASSYNFVKQYAQKNGAGFYEAISRIMIAHDFQILVDVYGNIPYTESLQGVSIRTPKYDNGLDIYKDLFRQLDTAIALLQGPSAAASSNPKISSTDLVFKGNADMWIKFANTLKLRMLVHTADVPEIDKQAEMDKINQFSEPFLGTKETAKINPGYSSSKPNPFYRAYAITETGTIASNADGVKGNFFALGNGSYPGYYQYDLDPRVDKFYNKPDVNSSSDVYEPATDHRGAPYGFVSGSVAGYEGTKLSAINRLDNTSPYTGLNPTGASSDAWILTSVESLFLQTEARERGIITSGPTAKDLLTNAINESFTFLGLTTDDAATYISANATYPDVDYDAASDKLLTIISQKWFAMNGLAPYEVWSDYRRTDIQYGVEAGAPLADYFFSILSGAETTVPVRLFYPQSEYSYNEANVNSQGDIDVFTSRVFWDKQ